MRFQKKAVITVASSHALHDIFTSFFAPLIPLLSEKLGFSYATAGILAVVPKAPALLNPFFGYIADKLIIKWFLILSPLISILAMGLLGIAPSITVLAVLLLITGFSGAIYHVSAPVIMRAVSGNKIGTGMSFFMFGGELARTLGPLLIISAISMWGLDGTYKLIPLGIIATTILYFQVRKLPDVRPHKQKDNPTREPIFDAIKQMKSLFIIIVPMLLFRAFSKTALTTFLPSYLVAQGMSVTKAGYSLALLEIFAAIGTLMAGSLSDKFGRKRIVVLIMAITPILMYSFTITAGLIQMILIGAMGLVFFASAPVFMAMVNDMNSNYPSLANGLYMMSSFAMSSIVSLLIGYWGDWYGLKITYQITAILSIGALPFALMIKETK